MKKGEITSNQIVILVILIVSFAVILFFWLSFGIKGTTDKEICHNSVITRGSVPVFKDTVELQCKTQKVCITADSCEDEGKYEEIIKVKSKDELKNEIIDLMYDCWWMMGEGKVDYQSSGAWKNLYCAQCAIIDFDDSVKKQYGDISYIELLNSMRSNSLPGKDMNYMEYLYGTDSIQAVSNGFRDSLEDKEGVEMDLEKNFIYTDGRYVLVTGIVKKGSAGTWIGVGAGVVIGAGIIIGSAGTGTPAVIAAAVSIVSIKGAVLVGGGGLVGGGAGWLIQKGDTGYLSPMLVSYNADVLNALECKDFTTLL